jgi:hypothetical protein
MSMPSTKPLGQNVNGALICALPYPACTHVSHPLRPTMSGLRKQWCPEIVDLVERMWAQDHQDRPTMTEVVTELEELVRNCK